jgi:hypothetical protein
MQDCSRAFQSLGTGKDGLRSGPHNLAFRRLAYESCRRLIAGRVASNAVSCRFDLIADAFARPRQGHTDAGIECSVRGSPRCGRAGLIFVA